MDSIKHTKIVATISDKHCEPEFLQELYDAGMNVVRINTAHQTTDTALKIVNNVRAVCDCIAILIDTKGPEIRTKNIANPIIVKTGDHLFVKGGNEESTENLLIVDYIQFAENIPVGSTMLIDDGELELKIIGKVGDSLEVLVCNDGEIKNKKSINVPGVTVSLPPITEKDKMFIEWAADNDIDFVAHSFVRNKEDVMAVQEILNGKNSRIKIISKIENTDGVDKYR